MKNNLVYKFRDWSIDTHKRWLTQPELFFSSPAYLNDPFDCSINYRYDKLSEKEILQKYREGIKKDFPQMNKKEVLREAKAWMKKGLLTEKNIIKNNENIFEEITCKQVGVLSFSKTKDNILLWSHYSNKHTGYCLAYDQTKLEKYLEEKYNTMSLVPFWFDVIYEDDYPIVIPDRNLSEKEYMEIQLKTKSNLWAYEKEYRIVMLGGTNINSKIPNELIGEVILGCNISTDHKEEILNTLKIKKIKVPVLVAKKHKEKFELVFENL